jgi:GntR family transcriptional regulator, sialic acid-inducible nan operon repressor
MTTVIRRRKLYEEVADRIQDMIRSGRFRTGDSLPSEREWSELFGVGRNAVREALFSLQKIGIVNVSSGERARVTRPTAEGLMRGISGAIPHLIADEPGMRYLQDARALFEIGLARHAALHAADQDIARLRKALAENERAVGEQAEFERTDVAFHFAIATIARNPIFNSLYEAMADWLLEQRRVSSRVQATAREAFEAHKKIFKAIAAHDPLAAMNTMQQHLNAVQNYYWKYIESQRENIGE